MFGAIKTIGTILTVASSAQMGKDLFDNYKSKKNQEKINEVHDFLEIIDIDLLNEAITTKNQELLINAVENIIKAAEQINNKNNFENIIVDVQNLANNTTHNVKKYLKTFTQEETLEKNIIIDAVIVDGFNSIEYLRGALIFYKAEDGIIQSHSIQDGNFERIDETEGFLYIRSDNNLIKIHTVS